MSCQLLLPGVLRELAMATPCPPALATLLRYSRRVPVFAGDDHAWRCAFFGVAKQQDWPVAPYAALGDDLPSETGFWFCADPVHLHLQRDSFTVADGVARDQTPAQAQQLVAALNAHFGGEGMTFHAPRHDRWYLRLAHRPAITTTPLSDAVGRNVHHLLPQGPEALQWHRWLNEVQMLLHGHFVNHDLERQGLLPVNSVWLWGGGEISSVTARPDLAVWASDAVTVGLARAHECRIEALPFSAEAWLAQAHRATERLIVLDQLAQAGLHDDAQAWREALDRLERHWFQPLLQALRRGDIACLELYLGERHGVYGHAVARGDLRKFWRRSRPWGGDLG